MKTESRFYPELINPIIESENKEQLKDAIDKSVEELKKTNMFHLSCFYADLTAVFSEEILNLMYILGLLSAGFSKLKS